MSTLMLLVPMSDDDLNAVDEWCTEHGYNDQATRDRVFRQLIMDQVYS